MTAAKFTPLPTRSTDSKKLAAKRAVSFSKTVKYSCPTKDTVPMRNDSCLQCTDKRRKYMRRGSKAPSMLKVSAEDLESIATEFAVDKTNDQFLSANKTRRLSLMSALKINFENSAIIEPKVASTIRRMSIEQQRNYTYELLSKV